MEIVEIKLYFKYKYDVKDDVIESWRIRGINVCTGILWCM